MEGDHQGRQFWHDVLADAGRSADGKAGPCQARGDGAGTTGTAVAAGNPLQGEAVLRRDDDGTEYNRVQTFEVVGIDPPEVDAFAPADVPGPAPQPQAADGSAGGEHDTF